MGTDVEALDTEEGDGGLMIQEVTIRLFVYLCRALTYVLKLLLVRCIIPSLVFILC